MARTCKIPTDPVILDKILEYMALGLSCRLIAQSLGEVESTVRNWKQRKDFGQLLAAKKLEILGAPLKGMADRFPKDFIERHPETRETFKPPKNENEHIGAVTLTVVYEDKPIDAGE
jgi:hypothetical protein